MKQTEKTFGWALALAAMVSLTACSKDDSSDGLSPDVGAVVITADWTEALAQEDIPDDYLLSIDSNDAVQAPAATAYTYPDVLARGTHDLLAYNPAEGFSFAGDVATINCLSDGTLDPMPAYLFSAMQDITISGGDTVSVSLPMVRRIIPASFSITITGSGADKVASLSATLEGLVASVNMRTGELGTENLATTMTADLTAAQADDNSRLATMRCRVTGFNPEAEQLLVITVTMTDGTETTSTFDFTERLNNFTPSSGIVNLSATMGINQDGEFSGSIDDWQVETGEVDLY